MENEDRDGGGWILESVERFRERVKKDEEMCLFVVRLIFER